MRDPADDPNDRERRSRALIDLDYATRCFGLEIDQLSEAERVFRAVRELAQVDNGGFEQYYFNSSGDLAHFAPSALRTIGASETARIVSEANGVFPGGNPSSDRETRVAALELLGEPALEQLNELETRFYSEPDDLENLLFEFVRIHRRSISGAEEVAEIGELD